MTAPKPTKKFAVIGRPIAHSLSPQIHQHFAEQFGEAISYVKLPAENNFAGHVRAFFEEGGMGMNVTLPYKHEAYELCELLSDAAVMGGAANTLWRKDDRLCGDNTDGAGLIKDLTRNLNFPIRDKKLLIIGAGGAVYGIIWPLLQQRPASICIANRTEIKAVKLVEHFQSAATKEGVAAAITQTSLTELARTEAAYDLVIQATAAGMDGKLPVLPDTLGAPGAFGYDLGYGRAAQPFLAWAEQVGIEASDGLGMLVEQAALSFGIWLNGLAPDTSLVIEALRKQESA